jgi:hypothetical protein
MKNLWWDFNSFSKCRCSGAVVLQLFTELTELPSNANYGEKKGKEFVGWICRVMRRKDPLRRLW